MAYDRASGGGLFSGLTPKDKRRLIIAGSSIVLLTTGAILGNKWYKNKKSNKAHARSLDSDDPAYFAKQIFLAIDGAGTDEDAVYDAFARIPSQEFYRKVQKAYGSLYPSRNLELDLQDDLSGDEYQRVSEILAQKPEKTGQAASYDFSAWSLRLHNAADGMGTDEDEIMRVLTEVPDRAAYEKLKTRFRSDWTISLEEMLEDELDEDELQQANAIIAKKR